MVDSKSQAQFRLGNLCTKQIGYQNLLVNRYIPLAMYFKGSEN